MSVADELFDLANEALATCSPQQQTIYRLVHGLDEHGTAQPRSLESVARLLNLSRSSARWHLAMSELAVYRHIATTLLAQRQEHDAADLPVLGSTTAHDYASYGMTIRNRSKQAYTNIELGAGSSEVMRASRIGNAETREAKYREIHERYTNPKQ